MLRNRRWSRRGRGCARRTDQWKACAPCYSPSPGGGSDGGRGCFGADDLHQRLGHGAAQGHQDGGREADDGNEHGHQATDPGEQHRQAVEHADQCVADHMDPLVGLVAEEPVHQQAQGQADDQAGQTDGGQQRSQGAIGLQRRDEVQHQHDGGHEQVRRQPGHEEAVERHLQAWAGSGGGPLAAARLDRNGGGHGRAPVVAVAEGPCQSTGGGVRPLRRRRCRPSACGPCARCP
ncbi:hypothetical protein ACFFX0_21675 [Citricoccus parietis]|uniref:Uncharacterized protein n=1 Tax=Citricoccus parietis TaxID=592307 RepID=A0ABV5G422_9MICC